MGKVSLQLFVTAFLLTLSIYSFAVVEQKPEQKDVEASKNLAEKLRILASSLNLREVKFDGGKTTGKFTNANDGNAFAANTTYHSYVWDYCEKWLGSSASGTANCAKWTPRFIARHGKDADRSPLEGYVWEEHIKAGGEKKAQGAGQASYSIWDIKTRNGAAIAKNDGRLNQDEIIEMRIKDNVQKGITKIANNTADLEIKSQREKGVKGAEEDDFVPPESLRLMARNWSKQLRNRLASIVGEDRTMNKKIEFALGEDVPDCDSYRDQVRAAQDRTKGDFKLDGQGRISSEIMARDIATLEKRYSRCMKMRQASLAMVNPQVDGEEIKAGDAKSERIFQGLARVNIGLMDSVGSNPEEFGLPEGVTISEDQIKQEMTVIDENGKEQKVYRTNADQLNLYNQSLLDASEGYKEIASRSPVVNDISDEVKKKQIKLRTRNTVSLNGLTGEQKRELAGIADPTVVNKEPGKDAALEDTLPELTITKK